MSAGKIVLALDGMGGDHAPAVVVDGADIARERYPGTSFLLFGDAVRLKLLVDKRKGLAKALEIVPAEDAVLADDKPVALRSAAQSSMRLADRRGAAGRGDGRRLGRQYRRADGHRQIRPADARASTGRRSPPSSRRCAARA